MNKLIYICTGRWLSLFGDFVQAAILPIVIYSYTSSVVLLSATFIAETIPWVLVTPFCLNYLENKFNDNFILRINSLLKGILTFLLAIFINNPVIVLIIFFLIGILNSMYASYNMKLMKNIIPQDKSESTLGIILALDDVISIIAPLIVSLVLVGNFNPIIFIFINGIGKMINTVLLLFVKIKNEDFVEDTKVKTFKETLIEMLSNNDIKFLTKIEFIRTILEGIIMPVLIVFVLEVLKSEEVIYSLGVMFACISQVVFSTLYIFIIKKTTTKKVVIFATLNILFTMVVLLFTKNIYGYLIAMIILGTGLSLRQLVAENMMISVPNEQNIKTWATNYNAIIAFGYLIGYGISILNLDIYFYIIISIVLAVLSLSICMRYQEGNKVNS